LSVGVHDNEPQGETPGNDQNRRDGGVPDPVREGEGLDEHRDRDPHSHHEDPECGGIGSAQQKPGRFDVHAGRSGEPDDEQSEDQQLESEKTVVRLCQRFPLPWILRQQVHKRRGA
jgi:hypothetical protein